MQGTLQAVSNMVEMRDPYTAGHERHVGLIAAAIAREMGWDEARCKDLELIGLVHDIGKIAVPSEILTKPTRLSALEMELMRGHAQAGYDILKNVPFRTPVAEIIDASARTGADVVALSYSDYASRREVIDTVAQLREGLAAPVELWIGGAGAVRDPRRLPPGVVVLRRAADAAAQVRLWRQRRGLA
ncbi:MAG: HD domain-containing phosphohydrolase, partial [Tepidimonas sp.]